MLAPIAGPCAALFCGILHREILMDLNDVDGDRENGVHTVPVVLGKRAALIAAAGLAAACVAAAGAVLTLKPGPGFLVSFPHPALVAPAPPPCLPKKSVDVALGEWKVYKL